MMFNLLQGGDWNVKGIHFAIDDMYIGKTCRTSFCINNRDNEGDSEEDNEGYTV